MALKPISVSQLNDYISRVLTTDPLLGNIRVSGEISNLKYHSSGHVYFSINDSESKINCFFPSSYVKNLEYEIADGLEVIINGYINVYKKGGTYTLFVRSIEVAGEGNLRMAFDLLKEKLDKEGLFDKAHKKPIPKYPKKVGIVTSKTGAAVQDILKIIKSRTSMVDVIIFPVLVQGEGAARDIAETLDYINENFDDIDTLIVGRGGGSTEDLWAFNEEILARAIYKSHIPVISAVGHEIDFSISDFVADLRAETPTAAAEIAVPNTEELLKTLNNYKDHLLNELLNKVKYSELLINNQMLDIRNILQNRITKYEHQIESFKLSLIENNPFEILNKGYSILETNDGKNVISVESLNENDSYTIHLKDGKATIKLRDIFIENR